MTRNEVKVSVREYPDGDGEYQTLYISNHWNRSDRVVLQIGGKGYTFLISDLRKALDAVEASQ